MNTLLKLTVIELILAVALIVMLIFAWKKSYWTLIARLHYSAATAAVIFMLWWLNYWNLLGYSFG